MSYLFELKDEHGHIVREKTVIWGFVFSIHSVMAITQDMLTCTDCPLKSVLTYKFSQDHIQLLFNKIRCRGGWNSNPNVLQLKYTLKNILIRNSIEPSNTGNCTQFQDSLCESNGLHNFTTKIHQYKEASTEIVLDSDLATYECMLIDLYQESPSELLDNVLYYISGFVVCSMLKKLKCEDCQSEFILDVNDTHSFKAASYPIHGKFTCFKQTGGLYFQSVTVLKIVKATEDIFKK